MSETTSNVKETRELARRRRLKAPIVAVPRGYVLVPLKKLEDLYDLAAIRRGRREKTVSLEEVERQLKRDGRL